MEDGSSQPDDCVQFWDPLIKKDRSFLEGARWGVAKMIKGKNRFLCFISPSHVDLKQASLKNRVVGAMKPKHLTTEKSLGFISVLSSARM